MTGPTSASVTDFINSVENETRRKDGFYILDLMNRREVVDEFEKYGISKMEATARINSLTDEEVTQIAGKLDGLPAAGFFLPWFLVS